MSETAIMAITDGFVNEGILKGSGWKHWTAGMVWAVLAAVCFGYI
jgi:hypothetical protein